jgi:hypothetical protein
VAALVSTFLHESGHGFGARLDGVHVSTGFNRVGVLGKSPLDDDFRQNLVVPGHLTSGGLLGPLTNWLLAICFAILFTRRRSLDQKSIIFAATATANSLIRLVPMMLFFVFASFGKVWPEDEVGWGLASVQQLHFPIHFSQLNKTVLPLQSKILEEPRVFFWPIVSALISSLCLFIVARHFWKIVIYRADRRRLAMTFIALIVIIGPIVFATLNWLDQAIRINW